MHHSISNLIRDADALRAVWSGGGQTDLPLRPQGFLSQHPQRQGRTVGTTFRNAYFEHDNVRNHLRWLRLGGRI